MLPVPHQRKPSHAVWPFPLHQWKQMDDQSILFAMGHHAAPQLVLSLPAPRPAAGTEPGPRACLLRHHRGTGPGYGSGREGGWGSGRRADRPDLLLCPGRRACVRLPAGSGPAALWRWVRVRTQPNVLFPPAALLDRHGGPRSCARARALAGGGGGLLYAHHLAASTVRIPGGCSWDSAKLANAAHLVLEKNCHRIGGGH